MTRTKWIVLGAIACLAIWGLVSWTPPAEAFPTYTCDPGIGNCSPSTATSGSLDSNCAQCHGDFNQGNYTSNADGQDYGDTLMNLHKTILASDCNTCHGSGGNSPVLLNSSSGGFGFDPIACSGCHSRAEDRDPAGCVDRATVVGFCADANGNRVEPIVACNTDADCSTGETCVISCGGGAGLRQHHWNANRDWQVGTVQLCSVTQTQECERDNQCPAGETCSISQPVLVSTRICADCHADAYPVDGGACQDDSSISCKVDADCPTGACVLLGTVIPVGEDVPPPYYFTPDADHPAKPTDPCNPDPNYVEKMRDGSGVILGSLDGLNNDGDFDGSGPLYDRNDPDCEDLCAGVQCDDGNICTTDSCDPATGECVFANNSASCEDGDFCTENDRCSGGQCVPGTFLNCNDGLFCNGFELCDEANDVCASGSPPCDPATETCNEATDTCDPIDLCAGVVCDDGNVCTTDACNPATGLCVFTPIPPPMGIGPLSFPNATTLSWAPTPDATHWNSYRGTIPVNMLGSRTAGSEYDHTCHESADAMGDGPTTSTEGTDPPVGTAYYFDVTGEAICGEGPLGPATAGLRPNASPCPTPP